MSRRSIAVLTAVGSLVWSADVRAQCTETTSTQDLVTAMEKAEGAFADVDLPGFKAATDGVRALLPCMAEPIPRNVIATVHRMQGMRAFVDREPDQSTQAFAAARAIEPGYRFPEMLVPAGHPMLRDYEAIPVDDAPVISVAPPLSGYLQFDGRSGTDRPTGWPTVVQLVGADGAIAETAYAWPADPLPDYEPAPGGKVGRPSTVATGPGTVGPSPEAPSSAGGGVGVSIPLAIAGGAAVITSAVLYGVAAGASGQYHDETTPYGDLDQLRGRTNGLQAASVGVGVAALGVGVTAVVVGKW
jgi:hypothetical protein